MIEQDIDDADCLRRRRFLQTVAGGTMFMTCLPLRTALAGVQVSFDDLSVLGPSEGQILLEVTRTLFPHSFLDDTIYAQAVRQMDSMSSKDAAQADQIRVGLELLPENFIELDQRRREAALDEISDTVFFKLARRTTINAVCNSYGRTHDVPNLFISDGSQFCSSGAAPPTLTIVTLAIRQAEHIVGQLKVGAI